MSTYTKDELIEAKISLNSTLSKCEKAILKLKVHSSQHTLMIRRIEALRIAVTLIEAKIYHN